MHKRQMIADLERLLTELEGLHHPGDDEDLTPEEWDRYEKKITGYEKEIEAMSCRVMDTLQEALYGGE